jgi:hypothetical protein
MADDHCARAVQTDDSVDSPPADYSVDLVPVGCWADSAPADCSAGSPLGDCWVDLVADDSADLPPGDCCSLADFPAEDDSRRDCCPDAHFRQADSLPADFPDARPGPATESASPAAL